MLTRRAFAFLANFRKSPPSSTVRLASFGGGGMAWSTIRGLAAHPKVKLVAVAEVDDARVNKSMDSSVRVHKDWRRMLDAHHKELDAACVGTPDHLHAVNLMAAMQLDLHVYGQKPLAHDIWEIRKLTEAAARKRLVTQMGIQQHASSEYRSAVAAIKAGVIGAVKEVHSWSEKKWGDPSPLPERSDPVPSTLDWNLWLGPCAARPYIDKVYHPGQWRKRLDFGTATFGDMGCHILDPVFSSLSPGLPKTVRSEGPKPMWHNWAINSVIHYGFANGVKIHWYDGDERPPRDVQARIEGASLPGQGSIFLGSKGVMLLPHTAQPIVFPKGEQLAKLEAGNHYFEFIDAIIDQKSTATPFGYSGPLTEAILLGPIATHFPKQTLEWDAARLRFRNSPEASRHVRRKARTGWKIKGL